MLFLSVCFICSVLMSSTANGQEINAKMRYAPTFRLFSINAQRMMQKLGTPNTTLSQFVGVSPKVPSYRFIVIMGEVDNLKKELAFLNKNRFSAAKKRIEWAILYTNLSPKLRKHVQSVNPFYPVLDDPFNVVRSRYDYVKSQYCYFIDYNGRLLTQECSGLEDITRYLDAISTEEE